MIVEAANAVTDQVIHYTITPFTMHGQEPPDNVAEEMLNSSVVFGVTDMSMIHTEARFQCSQAGGRYLSLPDYNMKLLDSPALQTDFQEITQSADEIAKTLTKGKHLKITTAIGTELTSDITNRVANSAPGWCRAPGTLASPPDAEANIAPLEDGSNGVLMVDGSIPCKELGLIESPLKVNVERGKIVTIEGKNSSVLKEVLDHSGNPATRILAEIGFGLNPNAKLCGSMLEDEGCLGTIHTGFGSNATFGGKNRVPFHLDMVIRMATVEVDGNVLLKDGEVNFP